MPLYEFQCNKCGHIFEQIQGLDDPAPPCPECGEKSHKLIAQVSFKLNSNETLNRIEKRYQHYIKGRKYKDAVRFLKKASEFVKHDRIKRLQEKVETSLLKNKTTS